MLDLSRTTILIVDFAGACKLRDRLLSTGAFVHVVKPAGALIWAKCKKTHAAFISLEDASTPLCEQLAALQCPANHRDCGRYSGCCFCLHVVAVNSRVEACSRYVSLRDPACTEQSVRFGDFRC